MPGGEGSLTKALAGGLRKTMDRDGLTQVQVVDRLVKTGAWSNWGSCASWLSKFLAGNKVRISAEVALAVSQAFDIPLDMAEGRSYVPGGGPVMIKKPDGSVVPFTFKEALASPKGTTWEIVDVEGRRGVARLLEKTKKSYKVSVEIAPQK